MSEVSTSLLSRCFGISFCTAFLSTSEIERPLTRCEPQSAEITEG